MAFLLLLDTSLLSQAGTSHYSQLLTLQHSTKLLFFKVDLSLSSKFRPSARPYKLLIGCQCRQEMGEIPNFTDSERMKSPKTDCALKVYRKTKNSISLDSRFVDLENTGFPATLRFLHICLHADSFPVEEKKLVFNCQHVTGMGCAHVSTCGSRHCITCT